MSIPPSNVTINPAKKTYLMHAHTVLVKCDHVSCLFPGRTSAPRESSPEPDRFIFGYRTSSGTHVCVRCSGPTEFRSCLTDLDTKGLLSFGQGGAA